MWNDTRAHKEIRRRKQKMPINQETTKRQNDEMTKRRKHKSTKRQQASTTIKKQIITAIIIPHNEMWHDKLTCQEIEENRRRQSTKKRRNDEMTIRIQRINNLPAKWQNGKKLKFVYIINS